MLVVSTIDYVTYQSPDTTGKCCHRRASIDLLVLDLEVKVSREPVVEDRLLDVTRRRQLHLQPRQLTIAVDSHGDVVRLRHPNEPVALHHPAMFQRTHHLHERNKNTSLTVISLNVHVYELPFTDNPTKLARQGSPMSGCFRQFLL